MIDQTQMYPSSISPLGLPQGITCNIERLRGGTWSPELLGRPKLWETDLKGGPQTPLHTMDIFLILPKMNGYVKAFKDKNNKLMSFRIVDDKLLEKYKTIWTKIEDLNNA